MINSSMLNQYRNIITRQVKDISARCNHGHTLNKNSTHGHHHVIVGTAVLARRRYQQYHRDCHTKHSSSTFLLQTTPHNRWLSTGSDDEKKHKRDLQEEEKAASETNQSNIANGSMLQQMKSLPNIITLSRIACTPYISYLILNDQYSYAAAGCMLAGFTDWLDGYVAKNWKLKTVLGTYLDPLADKVTVTILSCTLAYQEMLPPMVVFVWVGRDIGLLAATYYHVRLATKDDGRPVIDPARTPLKVEPTNVSKMNTVLQFFSMAIAIAQPMLGNYEYFSGVDADLASNVFNSFCWLTVGTTLISGVQYSDGSSLRDSGNTAKGTLLRGKHREKTSQQ
mmetsp:Transcript_6610/g.9664  ORF Transcript_6610/g.9664 Transcript_6610/m.9664 type:complete len:338 (-) Transcript_6610:336-1349(-)